MDREVAFRGVSIEYRGRVTRVNNIIEYNGRKFEVMNIWNTDIIMLDSEKEDNAQWYREEYGFTENDLIANAVDVDVPMDVRAEDETVTERMTIREFLGDNLDPYIRTVDSDGYCVLLSTEW